MLFIFNEQGLLKIAGAKIDASLIGASKNILSAVQLQNYRIIEALTRSRELKNYVFLITWNQTNLLS